MVDDARKGNITVPAAHCPRCRHRVKLEAPLLPVLAGHGRIVVTGSCPMCGQDVSGFQSLTPWEDLEGMRLKPIAVALLAIGMLRGVDLVNLISEERREDDMARAQQVLELPYGKVAAIFGVSKATAKQAIAASKRRAETHKKLLTGFEQGKTKAQLAEQHEMTLQEVRIALGQARRSSRTNRRDQQILGWYKRGWSMARIGRKYGIDRKEVRRALVRLGARRD